MLAAARDMAFGDELTVSSLDGVAPLAPSAASAQVSFGGGIRNIRGRKCSGAGAILCGVPGPDGDRPRLITAELALPAVQDSMVAEAWGLRVAVAIALARSRDAVCDGM